MYEYQPIYKGVKLNIAVNYMDNLMFVDQLGLLGCKQQKSIPPLILSMRDIY